MIVEVVKGLGPKNTTIKTLISRLFVAVWADSASCYGDKRLLVDEYDGCGIC